MASVHSIAPPAPGTAARKRIFDLAGAAAGLVLLSPVWLAAALAVGLTSPGGVLFRQERIGLGGRPFTLYKFRTMRQDCGGGPLTLPGDSRVTPVGRLLRRTRLDELPQLLNVLRGEMSLVGPRPEVREFTRLYTREQRQVFLVRPGLTGAGTLRFCREGELLAARPDPREAYIREVLPEKLRLELDYIPRACVTHDLTLLARTLAALGGRCAPWTSG